MPDEWDPSPETWGQVLLRDIQTWDWRAGVRPVPARPGTAAAFFVADGKDRNPTAQVEAKTSVLGRTTSRVRTPETNMAADIHAASRRVDDSCATSRLCRDG